MVRVGGRVRGAVATICPVDSLGHGLDVPRTHTAAAADSRGPRIQPSTGRRVRFERLNAAVPDLAFGVVAFSGIGIDEDREPGRGGAKPFDQAGDVARGRCN